MIKWFKKIDSLLLFLSLSLMFLFSFVGDIKYLLPNNEETGFKNYLPVKFVYSFESQGITDGEMRITTFNDDFELFYSVDGGKTYCSYSNENLLDIKSVDLTKQINSIRHKHPFGDLPQVSSVLIKAKHKSKPIFTKPKQLTYFKGFESELPIVNLIVNEDDLFGEYSGIMTLGEESWQDNEFYRAFWDRNANYKKRNQGSQRKTYFQYFESNILLYETTCGIQISGNATRSFPQKSFKIKASKKYGNNRLDFPFFGENGLKKYKSIVIRNSGNDNTKTLFADLFMHEVSKDYPVLTQKGHPVNVFLNGNYWGIYNIRERYDSYMISKKEKVKASDITILEGGAGILKTGDDVQKQNYVNFVDSLYLLDDVTDEAIEVINNKLNIKSFTYYILLETYFGNGDWLTNNTMWYKAGHKRWKWVLNDLDYGLAYLGLENVEANYFNKIFESKSITSKLFIVLMKNESYKKSFKIKANEITFNNNSYEILLEKYEQEIKMHVNRWRGNFTVREWKSNCKLNFSFMEKRKELYLKQVNNL